MDCCAKMNFNVCMGLGVILEADRSGLYSGVICNYLQTNKDAHGNLSLEFDQLASKYGIH